MEPSTNTCLICEKTLSVGHHSSDCLAKLKAENTQLATAYSELRTTAFEYLEAETRYQDAHIKNEAGIGESLKASQAHMKLRGVLADSVDFAAGLQIETECQKCGRIGGRVLSYSNEGCSFSLWVCPFCISIAENDRLKAIEFAGYVLYSGSHTFINNPYYKPFTENAKKAADYLHSLGLIEQHPRDECFWRYVGQTEGHAKNLKASTLEILKAIVPDAVNSLLLKPIDMILHCPSCGKQHVDAPEPGTDWDNPPHKSHLCHGCGFIFRPADVPTNGVAVIKTRGANDSPIPVNSNYDQQRQSSSEV